MSEIQYAHGIITLLLGIAGWFMKTKLKEQDDRLRELEKNQKEFPSTYLHKDDFREFKTELRGMFEEIKHDIRTLRETK